MLNGLQAICTGCRSRFLNAADAYTRECFALEVETSFASQGDWCLGHSHRSGSADLDRHRMLLEQNENGIEAEERKQEHFLDLAERFRNEKDPEAANRLGNELGRMVFGG